MNFQTYRTKFASKVRQLRLEQGLTQEDMEDGDDGVPYRTIQNIETGKSNPNLKTLYKLSRRLKVDTRDFFDG